MIHTEQATLAFNDFNISVRFCGLLCFVLEVRRFSHYEVTEDEGHCNQSNKCCKVRTSLCKPALPIINAEI
jgi:hypothetical protein